MTKAFQTLPVPDYRAKLVDIDRLTEEFRQELVVLVRSARRCLDGGDRAGVADAAQLLNIALDKTERHCELVNVLAEEVGANHVDPSQRARP